MKNYKLEKHLDNIELLKNLYKVSKTENETEMFSLVNILADFVQENFHYSFITNFNKVTNLLIDIINYSNSKEYNFISFQKKYSNITKLILKLVEDLLNKYQINVYFMGKDKYGLINTIINTSINFVGELQVNQNVFIKGNREFNVLILSEETISISDGLINFDKIIHYDKFMNDIYNIVEQIYHLNHIFYDYNYLVNTINIAKKNITESIFIGHSYSLNGLDETKLNENVVNLSLSSQDLYYSFKIAKNIIDENQNIKKCYIGTGYWTFYLDLSRAQNIHELARIENIYYPILKDGHNCKYLNTEKKLSLDEYSNPLVKHVFNLEKLYNCLSEIIYNRNKTYFNNKFTRQALSLIGNNKLNLMDDEKKYRLGKERAEQHNKMIRYVHTRAENEKIIKELLEYLNEKNIQVTIVNFPTTRYYNEFLNNQFKEDYYKILGKLEKEYNFLLIDLNNENNLFSDEDFRDLDHMSSLGAEKITNILNQKFKINES